MKKLLVILFGLNITHVFAATSDSLSQQSLAVVSKFYELIDTQKMDEYRNLFADSCEVYFGSATTPTMIDDVMPFVKAHYKAFPDYAHHVEQMFASGELVTVRVSYTGTHKESFFGVHASGKKVFYRGIFIFEVKNQLISKVWGIEDDMGLQKQIAEDVEVARKKSTPVFSCEYELDPPDKSN